VIHYESNAATSTKGVTLGDAYANLLVHTMIPLHVHNRISSATRGVGAQLTPARTDGDRQQTIRTICRAQSTLLTGLETALYTADSTQHPPPVGGILPHPVHPPALTASNPACIARKGGNRPNPAGNSRGQARFWQAINGRVE
jgi:hypothetical protein